MGPRAVGVQRCGRFAALPQSRKATPPTPPARNARRTFSRLGQSEGVSRVMTSLHAWPFSAFQKPLRSCRVMGSLGSMRCASLRRPHRHSSGGPLHSVPLLRAHRQIASSLASDPKGSVPLGHCSNATGREHSSGSSTPTPTAPRRHRAAHGRPLRIPGAKPRRWLCSHDT